MMVNGKLTIITVLANNGWGMVLPIMAISNKVSSMATELLHRQMV